MKLIRKYRRWGLSLLAVSILELVSKRVSLSVNQALGGALGSFVARFKLKNYRVARTNLALCFPEKSPEQRREILWHSFRELGKTIFEIDYIWHIDTDQVRSLITEIDGEEVLRRARTRDGSTIFATAHLGCVGMLARYLALDRPLHFLYKSSPFACVDRFMYGGKGIDNLIPCASRSAGIRQLLRACASKACILILPDQVPPRGQGVKASFFGHPAYTMSLLGKLAQRAPVVFAAAERLPRARGYRLRFAEAPREVYNEDPAVAALAINEMVERFICRCPQQYFWYYQRFRRAGMDVYRT